MPEGQSSNRFSFPLRRSTVPRQISRRQREEDLQRLVLLGVGALVLLAAAIVLVPFLKRSVIDPRQTIATVGDQRITRALYDKYQALEATGLTQPQILAQLPPALRQNEDEIRTQIRETVQQAQAAGGEPDPQIVERLVNNAVLAQSTKQAGIQLSDEDVQKKLDEYVAPPAASAAATGTPGASPSPTTAPASGTPTVAPATADEQQKVFTVIEETTGVSKEEYGQLVVAPQLAQERYVEKNVSKSAEQVHVRHILVASEADAKSVLDNLKKGTKFEQIARERSTYQANSSKGGDLGWAPRGFYDPAFEKAAFGLRETGQLSAPVKSQFGWHVIQLIQRDDDRPLSEQQTQTLGQIKLSKFVEEQRKRLEQAGQLNVDLPPSPTPARNEVG